MSFMPGAPQVGGGGIWDLLSNLGKPGGPKAQENKAAGLSTQRKKNPTPWAQRDGLGGFNKGELLLAGMGMLSGRNLQDGIGNAAGVAFDSMGRQKYEADDAERKRMIMQAMSTNDPKERRTQLMAAYPEMAGEAMAQQAFAPSQADPYTLAPGAVRFGADNQQVAANPKAVDVPEQWVDVEAPAGQQGFFQKNETTGQVRRVSAPPSNGNGISLQFGEGGALSGLSIGGDGGKGQTPAVVRDAQGNPVVTPSKQQALYNKSLGAMQSYQTTNDLVMEDIDRAVGMADAWTTGIGGAVMDGIPGTPAYDLNKILDSVKANIGFDKLQDMRDNSPTGGALGQVSEWELVLLQSVLGSLEQAQSKEQFVYNLNRIKEIKAEGARRRQEAMTQDFPSLQEYSGFATDAEQQVQDLSAASDDDLLGVLGLK